VLELDTSYFLLYAGDHDAIALLQDCLAKVDASDDRRRCLLHGRLARAMLLASDLRGAAKHNRDAARLARKLGNRVLLLDVLVNGFLMPASARPATLMANWRERVDEMRALAASISDDALGRAISIDIYASAEMGDRARMDAALERLASFSEERKRMITQWIATHGFAMRAIMAGDFHAAEHHAERGWDLGHRTHGTQFEGVYGIQMFAIRREQGRLAEVAPVIRRLLDADPSQSAWKPGFAVIASDLGYRQPAQRVLDELAAGGFVFALDAKHSMTLAYLAEVCVALEDTGHAERLYTMLLPYRRMTATAGVTTLCYGATGRFLGALAAVLGDWPAAEEHFDQALAMNEAMAAPVWLAHTQEAYAAMLHRRGRPGDSRRAEQLIESVLETAARLDLVAVKRSLRSYLQ
jgi:tetratricopeptide (TPR) repeat protein